MNKKAMNTRMGFFIRDMDTLDGFKRGLVGMIRFLIQTMISFDERLGKLEENKNDKR